MEKLILVFYIDIRNVDVSDMGEYIHDISKNLSSKDNDILNYFIPVSKDSKIECINPKLVSPEDFEKAKKVLDEVQIEFESIIKKINETQE